jgi:Ca2+-binding RTX toxin-like protein
MIGGTGNDFYYVDNPGDIIMKNASEGTDTVVSSICCTLPNNVETLVLTGSSAVNGTGDELNNYLTGNISGNSLMGMAGNDTLDGGAGNDTLIGGPGSDVYIYRKHDGQDVVSDYGQTGDQDELRLIDSGKTDPVLVKQGGDLYVMFNGNNCIDIQNQFSNYNDGIEKLQVSDGHYITRADIELIINAMSSINNASGMDIMQKFNAMNENAQYWNLLAVSWKQT